MITAMDDQKARADDGSFLDRPATNADVIAWTIAVPTMFFGVFVVPMLGGMVPNFKTMFDSLHAKLPAATLMVLAASHYGWFFFNILPWAVVVGMVMVLVRSRAGGAKVAVAGGAAFFISAMAGTVILGIWWPILELQKQLS